ncbi:MAG: hypothetical protein M1814_004933 [Vezdaea aestivalis]|nr:MAG: hypothetical protein M1814_004933 [Vezdaea aestivalis]
MHDLPRYGIQLHIRETASKERARWEQRQMHRSQKSQGTISHTSGPHRPLSASPPTSSPLHNGNDIGGFEPLSWPEASSSRDSLVFADSPTGTGNSSDVEYWLPSTFDSITSQIDGVTFQSETPLDLPPLINEAITSLSPSLQFSPFLSSDVSDRSTQLTTESLSPDIWPAVISEESLIPWLNVYYERLYPTIPVLDQSTLYSDIFEKRHRTDAQFGAMILSLCAFALTQPIQFNERSNSTSRATQANLLMEEATKMRSCSNFGEVPTLEAVLTSFYLFASLFGSNQHNAAWLRLREAVDLGETLGLPSLETYYGLDPKERERRLRTYLVLSITERAYALQKRHSISFKGRPGWNMKTIRATLQITGNDVPSTAFHDKNDEIIMLGLAQLMNLFDVIDEDVVDCWNEQCKASLGLCQKFNRARVIGIYHSLNQPPSQYLTETQEADVFITQKWLLDRLWQLSFSHKLLDLHETTAALRYDFAITIARDTLKLCQSLGLGAMEVHGIGIIEKIYNIAMSARIAMIYSLPLPDNSVELSHHDIQQGFFDLLLELRGGRHPYFTKFAEEIGTVPPLGVGDAST